MVPGEYGVGPLSDATQGSPSTFLESEVMLPAKREPEGTHRSDAIIVPKGRDMERHERPASSDSSQLPIESATTNRLSEAGCTAPFKGWPSSSRIRTHELP